MPTATINFSVPEEVKEAFQQTFAGENKSAIITQLMKDAVEERQRQHRRAKAIDALLELRQSMPKVTAAEAARARRQGRP
ncbi:MAG TPA: hypothetical protein VGS22_09110 [Thermoanaerobaculia bacterium]|nr:hypothetical protein [Thermoanaerobaculia bacterium]